MPALYPAMSAPEDFQVGDCVRKFTTEVSVTPYIGVVTHIVPSTYKVWVQWPIENTQESPETLIKVNPSIFGMPTVHMDQGYSSYEKSISEKLHGQIPKRATASDKMAIRIAHTFATKIVGRLIDDISACLDNNMSDLQTYNRVFAKYGDTCSDYIIRSSIGKVYASVKENKVGFENKGINPYPINKGELDEKDVEKVNVIINKTPGADEVFEVFGPKTKENKTNKYVLMMKKPGNEQSNRVIDRVRDLVKGS